MEVHALESERPAFGRPTPLFSTESIGIEPARGYGYDPSRDQFLVVQSTTPGRSPTMTFIENASAELSEVK